MGDGLTEVRKLISLLARRKGSRIVPRSPQMPCHWVPTTVTNPEVDMPFDDISAWHKIADLAEEGCPLEEVTLEQPQGEKAYVMIIQLDPALPNLYIKVQVKGQFIFGRSFHYSDRPI